MAGRAGGSSSVLPRVKEFPFYDLISFLDLPSYCISVLFLSLETFCFASLQNLELYSCAIYSTSVAFVYALPTTTISARPLIMSLIDKSAQIAVAVAVGRGRSVADQVYDLVLLVLRSQSAVRQPLLLPLCSLFQGSTEGECR